MSRERFTSEKEYYYKSVLMPIVYLGGEGIVSVEDQRALILRDTCLALADYVQLRQTTEDSQKRTEIDNAAISAFQTLFGLGMTPDSYVHGEDENRNPLMIAQNVATNWMKTLLMGSLPFDGRQLGTLYLGLWDTKSIDSTEQMHVLHTIEDSSVQMKAISGGTILNHLITNTRLFLADNINARGVDFPASGYFSKTK
jgi:hypothetical protein